MTVRLDQLTSADVKRLLKNKIKTGLVLPVGCLEQHGPYLPLGCDTAIARSAAEALALALLKESAAYRVFVMPDFAYTPSPGAVDTPGTISVDFGFLGAGLDAILHAAIRTPWDFVVIMNAHGHNQGRIIEAAFKGSEGSYGRKIPIVVINLYEFQDEAERAGLNPGNHGGEFEISLFHYYHRTYAFPEIEIKAAEKKKRPPNIYGLPIMARSREGIISTKPPNVGRAIAKAVILGRKIDKLVYKSLINNLDTYFEHWA